MVLTSFHKVLLKTARDSIAHGLVAGEALAIDLDHYDQNLQTTRATFVTLHKEEHLRGCIGIIEAYRPLIIDVSENAYAAAFLDPRFPALTPQELADITISISILSPPEPMTFSSEADLLQKIRPGIDGLLLTEGSNRGTFLPTVWESLPDPKDLLKHLKLKAGLLKNHWSETLTMERYTSEEFSE
jgi:uncharacterized protein